MRWAIGALVAAGHPVDRIFDWTWEEIVISAESVTGYHAKILDTALRAVGGALGADVGEVKHGSRRSMKSEAQKANEQVTDLMALASMGIPIEVNGRPVAAHEIPGLVGTGGENTPLDG